MLTHVPHIHSCSHTYAPTYSHTLKIPYYTHTQIHTCSHIYVYIHTLKDIPTQYIHVCTHSHRYTLSHTHILSHTETHSHTYQNTLIYALHTHTSHSHFHTSPSHFTLTDSYANSSIHTHACTHSYIPSNTHSHTHSLLKIRLAPGFLWSSWWICNSSCFGVSISSALLELILNGSFSQIFQFKPFIFPRSFLVCVQWNMTGIIRQWILGRKDNNNAKWSKGKISCVSLSDGQIESLITGPVPGE